MDDGSTLCTSNIDQTVNSSQTSSSYVNVPVHNVHKSSDNNFTESDTYNIHDHVYCLADHTHIIKFSFINVCGLMPKLFTPDFDDFAQKYDICCIAETKLD